MKRATRSHRTDSSGFTLVEVLVAAVVLIVVLLMAGGLVVASTNAQQIAGGISSASSETQAAADSITAQMRDSSAFKVDAVGTTDQILRARVSTKSAGATITWSCMAWYYSAADHRVLRKISATAIATPTAAGLSSWTRLLDGVYPVAGSTIFTGAAPQLRLDLAVDAGDDTPRVDITASGVSRSEDWNGGTCFTP